jgi:hypothetical protein
MGDLGILAVVVAAYGLFALVGALYGQRVCDLRARVQFSKLLDGLRAGPRARALGLLGKDLSAANLEEILYVLERVVHELDAELAGFESKARAGE